MIHYICTCKSSWPLEYLYNCPSCMTLACRDCTSTTVNCYYCPQCLFEVPASSNVNCCIRNCYSCSYCYGSLDNFTCNSCQVSFPLDKSHAEEEKEFMKLVKHFNNLSSISTTEKTINTIKTQRNPLKTGLHSKKIRKCRQCHQILVKPEPKASSTKFLIRYSAMDYFPIIKKLDQSLVLLNQSSSKMGISFIATKLPTVTLEPGMSTSIPELNNSVIQISCTTDDSILNFSIKYE